MNRSEVAKLLTMCAAFDARTIGEADVIAWHAVLAEVAYPDAEAAVAKHYSDSDKRIMPAHVRNIARQLANERSARKAASTCSVPECDCRGKRLVPMPPAVRKAIDSMFRPPKEIA